MAAKMFPYLKLLCWLFMGPTFGYDTKQRNSFWSNLVFFTIKRFWQYYSKLNIIKFHFNDEFLVLLGPIISIFFASSNEENKPKQQRVCALVLSLWCQYTECRYFDVTGPIDLPNANVSNYFQFLGVFICFRKFERQLLKMQKFHNWNQLIFYFFQKRMLFIYKSLLALGPML
jgi:hypothetical protein